MTFYYLAQKTLGIKKDSLNIFSFLLLLAQSLHFYFISSANCRFFDTQNVICVFLFQYGLWTVDYNWIKSVNAYHQIVHWQFPIGFQ